MLTQNKDAYWWECLANKAHRLPFGATNVVQLVHKLAENAWREQGLLVKRCTCGGDMRLTYLFPRKADPETVQIFHIVGLPQPDPVFLPMMWETEMDGWDARLFDFKYIYKGSHHGLNKPAVFTRSQPIDLFKHYTEVTGNDPPCWRG